MDSLCCLCQHVMEISQINKNTFITFILFKIINAALVINPAGAALILIVPIKILFLIKIHVMNFN